MYIKRKKIVLVAVAAKRLGFETRNFLTFSADIGVEFKFCFIIIFCRHRYMYT